jgi:transposase
VGAVDSKCTNIDPRDLGEGEAARVDSKCTNFDLRESKAAEGKIPAVEGPRSVPGRRSSCEPFEQRIREKLAQGLSAQRIYQDLRVECGYRASYQAVKRYVRKLQEKEPVRVWRMESQPGEEAQVDFGLGAPIQIGGGKTRRTWVLRMVLSYSRKAYSEAVLAQDTETFLRVLENGFRELGGVPQLLNLDNLKAAVLQADWFDPQLNPKFAEFCRHYAIHVMPCRPRQPEHKGKVERGVGYVKNNALKGRRFASLAEQNLHLAQWEKTVADQRIHGTTRKQVSALFAEEKAHLQPLPAMLFPCYQEAQRTVHRDSYVEVARAFYEVPPEYIGRQMWVRWDSRCVRVLDGKLQQVAMHVRLEAGKFSRSLGCAGLSRPVRGSCVYWEQRAALFGEHCRRWARGMFEQRGPQGLRSVMALCELSKKHSAGAMERACRSAIERGLWRYKDVRRLIETPQGSEPMLPFLETHPLIRDLDHYAQFLAQFE